MHDIFHVMEINHSLYDVINDFVGFFFCEYFFFLVKLVEETTVFEVFSDELVLISGDTDAHVEDDIGVFEATEDLELLKKVLLILVFPCLDVIFNSYWTRHVLAFVHFTVSTFADKLL